MKLPTIVLTEPHNVRTVLVDSEIVKKLRSKKGKKSKISKKYRKNDKRNSPYRKKKLKSSNSKIITEKAN